MTRTVFRGGLVFDGTGSDPRPLAERIEGVWLGGRRTAA